MLLLRYENRNIKKQKENLKIANLSNFSTTFSDKTEIDSINIDEDFKDEIIRAFNYSKKQKVF